MMEIAYYNKNKNKKLVFYIIGGDENYNEITYFLNREKIPVKFIGYDGRISMNIIQEIGLVNIINIDSIFYLFSHPKTN